MGPIVIRIATEPDLARVTGLRYAAYEVAPWLPGLNIERLACDQDPTGTVVLMALRGDELLSTMALSPADTADQVQRTLEYELPVRWAQRLPALVLRRGASVPSARGLGLLPMMRRYAFEASVDSRVEVLLSAHAVGTPNVRSLERVGYELVPARTRRGPGGTLAGAADVLIAGLPKEGFRTALARHLDHYAQVLEGARWEGPPVQF